MCFSYSEGLDIFFLENLFNSRYFKRHRYVAVDVGLVDTNVSEEHIASIFRNAAALVSIRLHKDQVVNAV